MSNNLTTAEKVAAHIRAAGLTVLKVEEAEDESVDADVHVTDRVSVQVGYDDLGLYMIVVTECNGGEEFSMARANRKVPAMLKTLRTVLARVERENAKAARVEREAAEAVA